MEKLKKYLCYLILTQFLLEPSIAMVQWRNLSDMYKLWKCIVMDP